MGFKELYTFLLDGVLSLLFVKDVLVKEIETMESKEFALRAKSASSIPTKSNEPPMIALFSYKDPLVKTVVWNMKYKRNKKCFLLAGKLLYEKLLEFPMENTLILPVPLSLRRKRKRTYNQTEILAEVIMKNDIQKKFEIGKSCLIRKDAPSQTSLSRLKREENLLHSFTLINPLLVQNRNIIILDDVITTGATIREISKTLQSAGASVVCALAFAH